MAKDNNKVKPTQDKPKPDPKLFSYVEKGYKPAGKEKRGKAK